MSKKTFISFLGKAKYVPAKYEFSPGEETVSGFCFAEAALKRKNWEYDQVIFYGTVDSVWWGFFEDNNEGKEDEQERQIIHDTIKDSPAIVNNFDFRKKMETFLQKKWGAPFSIRIHESELNDQTEGDIYDLYMTGILNCSNNILLDITHGLRWMPVFMLSILKFKDSFGQSCNEIEVIYGDLWTGQKDTDGLTLAPVRYLGKVLDGQRISHAIGLFFQKFESEPLVEELKKANWPKGADAVQKIGTALLSGYILPLVCKEDKQGVQMGEPLQQLKRALDELRDRKQLSEYFPQWILRVETKLQELFDDFLNVEKAEDFPIWRRCRKVAELYADREMYSLACLTLVLAQEQVLLQKFQKFPCAKYECRKKLKDVYFMACDLRNGRNPPIKNMSDKKFGDYPIEHFDETKKCYDMAKQLSDCGKIVLYKDKISEMKKLRNGIAHCGIKSRKEKHEKDASTVKIQFEQAINNLDEIAEGLCVK